MNVPRNFLRAVHASLMRMRVYGGSLAKPGKLCSGSQDFVNLAASLWFSSIDPELQGLQHFLIELLPYLGGI